MQLFTVSNGCCVTIKLNSGGLCELRQPPGGKRELIQSSVLPLANGGKGGPWCTGTYCSRCVCLACWAAVQRGKEEMDRDDLGCTGFCRPFEVFWSWKNVFPFQRRWCWDMLVFQKYPPEKWTNFQSFGRLPKLSCITKALNPLSGCEESLAFLGRASSRIETLCSTLFFPCSWGIDGSTWVLSALCSCPTCSLANCCQEAG